MIYFDLRRLQDQDVHFGIVDECIQILSKECATCFGEISY